MGKEMEMSECEIYENRTREGQRTRDGQERERIHFVKERLSPNRVHRVTLYFCCNSYRINVQETTRESHNHRLEPSSPFPLENTTGHPPNADDGAAPEPEPDPDLDPGARLDTLFPPNAQIFPIPAPCWCCCWRGCCCCDCA